MSRQARCLLAPDFHLDRRRRRPLSVFVRRPSLTVHTHTHTHTHVRVGTVLRGGADGWIKMKESPRAALGTRRLQPGREAAVAELTQMSSRATVSQDKHRLVWLFLCPATKLEASVRPPVCRLHGSSSKRWVLELWRMSHVASWK